MLSNPIIKPKAVNYFEVPPKMWKKIRKLFPQAPQRRKRGRPRADNRAVLNGIWYVLWTGCQWKAVHKDWFGVSSSVLHERFQSWQQQGIFAKIPGLGFAFKTLTRVVPLGRSTIEDRDGTLYVD